MRRIPINSILQGTILARTIYNKDGTILLRAGYPLNENIISIARNSGIKFVYINDSYSEQVIDNVIKPELREKAIYSVRKSFKQLYELSTSTQENITESYEILNSVSSIAGEFVESILPNKQIAVNLVDLKVMDDNTYNHSVNTTLLAIVLAMELGYEKKQLQSIAVGTLLHDFGKVFIPKDLLLKPGKLSPKEFNIVQNHPYLGYTYLQKQLNIDPIALSIVLQHHEKVNGFGYPNHLKSRSISPFAKIVAICDVYEALTADRPYRKAVSPSEALELLMGSCGTDFDLPMVQSFISRINPYPVGSVVKLSNKHLAIIKKTNPKYVLRPMVSVIKENRSKIKLMDLDLMKRFDIVIEGLYREAL